MVEEFVNTFISEETIWFRKLKDMRGEHLGLISFATHLLPVDSSQKMYSVNSLDAKTKFARSLLLLIERLQTS